MTSINPANSQTQNPYLKGFQQTQRTRIQVNADAIRKASDQFVSRVQDKLNATKTTGKAAYEIKARTLATLNTPQNASPSSTSQGTANGTTTPEVNPAISTPDQAVELDGSKDGSQLPGAQASGSEEAGSEPEPFSFDDLVHARELIGSRDGDADFDARYDLDGDGEIKFTDLVKLVFELNNQDTEPPTE